MDLFSPNFCAFVFKEPATNGAGKSRFEALADIGADARESQFRGREFEKFFALDPTARRGFGENFDQFILRVSVDGTAQRWRGGWFGCGFDFGSGRIGRL